MDAKTLKILEYYTVLEGIRRFAASTCSKDAIMNITPCEGKENIEKALGEVIEAYEAKYKLNLSVVEQFDDCLYVIEKAKKGAMLSPGELNKVKTLLRAGRIAQTTLAQYEMMRLKNYSTSYFIDKGFEDELDLCILSENELSDNASDTLKSLRRKIAEKKNALREKLSSYFRKSEYSKYMQDNLVTVRGDRFVIPVKSEYRSMVPGLIHDMSSSGATVFIEPFAVVETNNEIKSLMLKEAAEVERILFALSERVASIGDNLVKMQSAVMSLDIIFAKMHYSVDIDGTIPLFNTKGVFCLRNARHPLIDKRSIVPVNIEVGKDYKILMITGPNTGGKTVCLKTVGLLCLMAYTGLMIPCDEGSEVAICDNIFCDIGDEQSIAESLSTFSSHIVNLVKITDNMTKDTLLLLDELGGGTDPQEGAALAIGIIKYIEMWRSTAIITTHYGELKEYALASPNILNAAMQFDKQTYKPTYRLMLGLPGTSNALAIAQTLGLNEKILDLANKSMNEEKVKLENLIKSAEEVKSKSEDELKETELLKAELLARRSELEKKQNELNDKLEKINANAKTEIKRLVAIGVEKADELIEQIKQKIEIADEKALLEAKSLKKRLEAINYRQNEEQLRATEPIEINKLKVGDKVFVQSLNSVGELCSLPDKRGEVVVALGAIRSVVRISELKKPIQSHEPPPKKRVAEYKSAAAEVEKSAIVPEVNVIGYTVSEAIEIVEPHLMSMADGTGRTLRVVHGKGTGALGKGLQQYFKTSPYVNSYRYGRYGEGERGVTIVELN